MSIDQPFSFESTNGSMEIARAHVRHGRLLDAERVYQQIAAEHPDDVEALRFLANAALARSEPGHAIALLSRAAQADRSNTGVLLELGLAYRNAQRMDEARSVFAGIIESSNGSDTTARLLLANVLELDNRPEQALLQYFRAIVDAQSGDRWLSDSTTEPGMRRLVQHAMQYTATERRKLFEHALQTFRRGMDVARLGRVETALATYLRDGGGPPEDPRQKPTFMYIPSLGADCYLDTTLFDWLPNWSARVSLLDHEALACQKAFALPRSYQPFSLESIIESRDAAAMPVQHVPLYQRGIFFDSIKTQAPALCELVEAAPLVRISNYAPEAAIIAVQPGNRTVRHHGRTNAFCMIVVVFCDSAPLQVMVGGELRRLKANESLAFDPSFEFEFSATDDREARALAIEVWNPGVSQLERDALTALTIAAVNFDTRLQELA